MEEEKAVFEELMRETMLPAITIDGVRFKVFANVGNLEDVREAIRHGAEGIGLLRTEFMYINKESMPTEEELLEVFLEIAKLMKDRPIIVRTLDIGCDKPLPYIRMPDEANPFLGWRGIRLTLDNPRMMKTQLKAILRARKRGNFRLMFPMVTTIEEIRKAKELLMDAMDELKSEGIPFGEVKVGTMIETPASALIVDILADEVDFFSIGTNDLTQYVMAADRGNARVSNLYNPFHPAVLRMIHKVIEEAHDAGKEVGMCGEMASDPKAIPLLIGMGLDELSMIPALIPRAKKAIRSISKEEAESLVQNVLRSKTLPEVLDLISEFNRSKA
jgi:phosphoenolpyruvate-protein phosphotransferase